MWGQQGQNVPMAIRESMLQLLTIKKYDGESNSAYLEIFESIMETFFLLSGKNILCNEKNINQKWMIIHMKLLLIKGLINSFLLVFWNLLMIENMEY